MASEEQQYSSAFKKKVATKALNKSKQDLDDLAEEYDLSVSQLLVWRTELKEASDDSQDIFSSSQEVEESFEEQYKTEVEISDPEVVDSFEHGVMFDQLNYKRLISWSVLGVILVIIFFISLFEMYQYNERVFKENVSEKSEYYQANQMKKEARDQLNSFGVVDLKENVYRIPIDSAINKLADEKN